jgi:hypothetical protein
MRVPRLKAGQGYKGPDYYNCFNTGTAPCIFHSRQECYLVGPEMRVRDAMRAGVRSASLGEGRQRIWIFKGRKAAVNRFMVLCGEQILENYKIREEHQATLKKAQSGNMAAVLALGDF